MIKRRAGNARPFAFSAKNADDVFVKIAYGKIFKKMLKLT